MLQKTGVVCFVLEKWLEWANQPTYLSKYRIEQCHEVLEMKLLAAFLSNVWQQPNQLYTHLQ